MIGKTVIGVDDLAENRLLLKMLLEANGYNFFGCEGGRDCLTLLQRVVPGLILLDIQMPDMDGFETCRQLRRWPQFNDVPVAFLTASKTPQDLRAGLDVGGNDFILKPFDATKLLARVAHWCGRRAPPARLPEPAGRSSGGGSLSSLGGDRPANA